MIVADTRHSCQGGHKGFQRLGNASADPNLSGCKFGAESACRAEHRTPEQILAILSLELRNRQIARDDELPSVFVKRVYDLKEDGTAARVQIAAVHVFEEQSEHVATAADVDDLVDSYVGSIDHTIEIRPFGIAASDGIVGVLLQQVPNRHSSDREPLPRRMRSHELTEEHLRVKRGR